MTTFQRIIKYGAIAFGAFLAINIITVIVSAIISIFGITYWIKGGQQQEGFDNKIEEIKIMQDIENLDIDLNISNLKIIQADEFKVQYNSINNGMKIDINNDTLVIKDKNNKLGSYKNNAQVILSIPDNYKFKTIVINTGVGSNTIESLTSEVLDLNIGMGTLNIDNLEVNQKAKISGGAGKVEIKNAVLNNLKLDTGVGEFSINGAILTGKNKIDCGIGKLYLKLNDVLDNYKIETDIGIGGIYLNNKSCENDNIYGGGENHIEVNGGIGRVDIITK